MVYVCVLIDSIYPYNFLHRTIFSYVYLFPTEVRCLEEFSPKIGKLQLTSKGTIELS